MYEKTAFSYIMPQCYDGLNFNFFKVCFKTIVFYLILKKSNLKVFKCAVVMLKKWEFFFFAAKKIYSPT